MGQLFEQLSARTGFGSLELRRILLTAPRRYKIFPILKRNGDVRIIAQPAREVKRLQRALMSILLESLPIHSSATGYRRGLSIVDNAVPHAANGPIFKLDFSNFFPSLRSLDWEAYCHKTKCLTDSEDVLLSSHLLFRRVPGVRWLRLAIGAPSSPMLSNILMYDFDALVASEVEKDQVVYTRYADDMTFSAPRTGYLTRVHSTVIKIIDAMKSPRLCLNEAKTTYVTKKYHRSVTGLTLSNDGRVTLGRDKKRLISATIHRATVGKLSSIEKQMLAGTLAYVNAVEPEFLNALRRKYGLEAVANIQRYILKGTKLEFHKPPLANS